MENKKQNLKKLKERLKELLPIVSKKFKKSKELEKYVDENIELYKEANSIHEEIEQLEWELMTPEEQKKAEKRDRFLTLKAKGEPFDLEEFNDLNE